MIQSLKAFVQPDNSSFQLLVASSCGLIVGISSLWISPLWIIVGVIGLVGAMTALKRPELMPLGYLFIRATIFAPNQNPGVSLGFGKVYLTDFFLFGALGLVVLRWIVESKFKILRTPLDWPLILFFALALISAGNAILAGRLPFKLTLEELRILASYLFFFAVTNLIQDRKQIMFLVHGILLLATFAAIAMIVQYGVGNRIPILPGRVESLNTEGQSMAGITRILAPGQSLVMFAFVVLAILMLLEPFRPIHVWLFAQWLLSSVALIMTFNRNFWVAGALALIMAAYLITEKERQRLIAWGGVVALLAFVLVVMVSNLPQSKASQLLEASAGRLLSLANSNTFEAPDSSLRWRDFEYYYSTRQVAAHPLFGVGPGADYRPTIPGMDRPGFDGRDYTHNGHMWIMAKNGIPCYLFLMWSSLLFMWRGLMYWRSVQDPSLRACVLSMPLVHIGVLLGSIVNPMLMQEYWTPLIGLMMGFSEVILHKYGTTSQIPSARSS